MATFTVQPEYGYVLLAATSTFFIGFWHGGRCGFFRKACMPLSNYPAPYADSAMLASASEDATLKKNLYLWNCAQRAHGNYNENQPSVVAAMLIAGLKYPVASAVCGAAWGLGRIAYAVGYTRADKEGGRGRLIAMPMWLFQMVLFGMSGAVGVGLLM
ncbi:hypothetical protein AAFC00_004009 [Neodothiora populina]|uniref:Membrane-associated proteins in eicosanoid and glutathione metabolism n=1 Tax=Neodothiora populina TaxID=2781224 RepID=A0ABR3PIG7_9PEZI